MLLDKPSGLGSTPALQSVRRLLRAAKAGHAGTLDPLATGMLPLCFGQATKACGQLLGSSKAYRARLLLGQATETGDAAGRVLAESPVPELSEEAVAAVLAGLQGPQLQTPPMYSALKLQGRPLYELARQGHEVPREPRPIVIERLELAALQREVLDFEVVCSKGTYVRVLGEEIARRLGTLGHLAALRRLWVAPFEHQPMVGIDTIREWAEDPDRGTPPWLLPVDRAFTHLGRLDLDATAALHLRQGRTLQAPKCAAAGADGDLLRAYDPQGRFLGLVGQRAGRLRVERLFVPGAG
ncbi:MAG TPA: tRNA pseudouridine(55) synthase TruB [Steroidobacteraceae bacterium]|nr:tRNA pseudouridine(55) synthase TruB [Steroidobacteraceae bacterium]